MSLKSLLVQLIYYIALLGAVAVACNDLYYFYDLATWGFVHKWHFASVSGWGFRFLFHLQINILMWLIMAPFLGTLIAGATTPFSPSKKLIYSTFWFGMLFFVLVIVVETLLPKVFP